MFNYVAGWIQEFVGFDCLKVTFGLYFIQECSLSVFLGTILKEA